jgi:hypothetical protein
LEVITTPLGTRVAHGTANMTQPGGQGRRNGRGYAATLTRAALPGEQIVGRHLQTGSQDPQYQGKQGDL